MDTSYLSQQLTTIVKRLHGLYDEIGVASHERDSRDAEVYMRAHTSYGILTYIASLCALRDHEQPAESCHERETRHVRRGTTLHKDNTTDGTIS